MAQASDATASSTGQAMTGGDWLDVHFEAARPEYEAQLRSVGIQPGWHLLDAGCGSGSFLPWLAEIVGPSGRLVGSVLALPFPDHAFDGVWRANTTQYLTDEEPETTLAELQQVLQPGDLVGIKKSKRDPPSRYRAGARQPAGEHRRDTDLRNPRAQAIGRGDRSEGAHHVGRT